MQNALTLIRAHAPRCAFVVATLLIANLVLAISAKIELPFWPVPMTLETLAVLGLAGALGARLAAIAIVAWLAEGAAGLAVFAGAAAGPAYFLGPTAGYLLGFLLAALFVGWAADRGLRARPLLLFLAMLGGVGIIYLFGVAWLANLIGWPKAVQAGLLPFIPADLTKAALAAALVAALGRLRPATG